ncbi:kinase-like domain-containing protein [Sphaerosporella brunnea]|uniref:Kinase-like domain-containing protein n=1 Tax=Sphaerosporella brunnea TaxID=1250544 RepID=A0A5J5F9Z6_9PEZI|nr:kinase-like domain-containing protein [Sphaerosporella brunnea]
MEAIQPQTDASTNDANPSPSLPTASSRTSSKSCDLLDLFAPLLSSINFQLLGPLAVGVRRKRSPGIARDCQCTVIQPPKPGSFNLVYILEFSDGVKWVIRIPLPEDGGPVPESSRSLYSEIMTTVWIRRNTSIPMPEIYDFCENSNNEIGVPYLLMEFVEGFRVCDIWFDDSGPTPKHERRLRILDNVAAAMSQLSQFQFDKIGSLHFAPRNPNPTDIGPCNVLDELGVIAAAKDDAQSGVKYQRIGPFETSQQYFQALFRVSHEISSDSDPFFTGTLHLLKMMIEYIPRSVFPDTATPEDDHESFVLTHPDFDSQNFLVSENGTLMAVLDWDGVHTVPRCIGYDRYPGWITRDWDPLMYGYGIGDCVENSPEELDFYRQHYAERMVASASATSGFQTKSHLFEALWGAVSSPMCAPGIIEKLFTHVFPSDEQDNLEEPIHFYETALGLARGTLEKEKELRVRKEFEKLFNIRR